MQIRLSRFATFVLLVVDICLILFGLKYGFWLMNQSSDAVVILGVLLVAILAYFGYFQIKIVKYLKGRV